MEQFESVMISFLNCLANYVDLKKLTNGMNGCMNVT